MRPTLLFHYCKSDLFSPQVRYTSLLLLTILFFASTIGTICVGLPEFYDYKRKHELEQRPGALTLHFSAPPLASFGSEQYRSLKNSFELKCKESVEVFANYQVNLECAIDNTKLRLKINGRILDDNDTSLIGEDLVSGGKVKNMDLFCIKGSVSYGSDDNVPVIISNKFRIAFKQKGNGPFICRFNNDNTKFNLMVVAELKHEQPDDNWFYVPKSYMDSIHAKAMAKSITSNEITISGLEDNACNDPKFIEWCRVRKYQTPYESGLDVKLAGERKSNSVWDAELSEISKFFLKSTLKIKEYSNISSTNNELNNYKSISGMFVNVGQIKDLRNVEEVFNSWRESQAGIDGKENGEYMGLPKLENPVMIRLVQEVDEGTKILKFIVTYFLWSLLGILILCFGTMIYTRIEQKKSEIGLLRMMGGSRFTIQGITVLQTFILGFLGIAMGVCMGMISFSVFLFRYNIPFNTVFDHDFAIRLLISSFGCLIFMVIASIAACYFASIKSPSQLINAH